MKKLIALGILLGSLLPMGAQASTPYNGKKGEWNIAGMSNSRSVECGVKSFHREGKDFAYIMAVGNERVDHVLYFATDLTGQVAASVSFDGGPYIELGNYPYTTAGKYSKGHVFLRIPSGNLALFKAMKAEKTLSFTLSKPDTQPQIVTVSMKGASDAFEEIGVCFKSMLGQKDSLRRGTLINQ